MNITDSPRGFARIAGFFYLLTGFVAFDLYGVVGKLAAPANAAATANNILMHESLFRTGATVALLGLCSYLMVTALFYILFRPAGAGLSMVAALFGAMGCAIQTSSVIFHFAPLVLLKNQHLAETMRPEEVQGLAAVCLRLYGQGFNIGLLFFGFYCVLIGWLIIRADFLPTWLGVLMLVGGLAYLVFCLGSFLSPGLATQLSRLMIFPGLGEGLLMLWLLVFGVDAGRWKGQA